MCRRINLLAIIYFCCFNATGIAAQSDKSWWKNIFRTECDTTLVQADNSQNPDSILIVSDLLEVQSDSVYGANILPALPVRNTMGIVVVRMEDAVTEIELKALSKKNVLKGYRVQIYFGDLETARAVKAQCRKRLEERNVYLESIAPNYSVVVGDFRNRWEAESALPNLKKRYPSALIIPTDIELPKL